MATSPKKRKPPAKKAPAKKAPAKKAPAPAKDLKPEDSRSSYLKKKAAQKASSGTLTERMGEVKNRPNKGLPARTGQARGNLNRAITPDKINLGGQGGTGRSMTKAGYLDKFKPIPLGNSPKLLAGPALKAARIGLGGPATAVTAIVDPNFMNWKSERVLKGELDAAKPSGKLFSPSANRAAGKGNPKAVNPYKAPKTKLYPGAYMNGGRLGGLFKPRIDSRNADMSGVRSKANGGGNPKTVNPYKAPVSMAGGGPDKRQGSSSPSMAAVPKPKARPTRSAVTAPKPKARPNVAPAFKGNWTGSAPTEMQKRGVQKSMRPNLLDLIRNKKK